jgi:hypothetical protein
MIPFASLAWTTVSNVVDVRVIRGGIVLLETGQRRIHSHDLTGSHRLNRMREYPVGNSSLYH